MTKLQWTVLLLAVGVVLGAVIFQIIRFVLDDFWVFPLTYAGIIFLTLFTIVCVRRRTHSVHIHHYFIFAALCPLFNTHHPASAVFQALCMGIAVEGVSRWGADHLMIEDEEEVV